MKFKYQQQKEPIYNFQRSRGKEEKKKRSTSDKPPHHHWHASHQQEKNVAVLSMARQNSIFGQRSHLMCHSKCMSAPTCRWVHHIYVYTIFVFFYMYIYSNMKMPLIWHGNNKKIIVKRWKSPLTPILIFLLLMVIWSFHYAFEIWKDLFSIDQFGND